MKKSNNFFGQIGEKREDFIESPKQLPKNQLLIELDTLKESIKSQQNDFQKQIDKSKLDSALSLQSKRKSKSRLKALKEISSRNKLMEAFLEIEKIQEFSRNQIEKVRKVDTGESEKRPKKLQKLSVKKAKPESFSSSNLVPLDEFKGKGKFDSNDFLVKRRLEKDRYEEEERRLSATKDLIKNVADQIIESKEKIDSHINTQESRQSLKIKRKSQILIENSKENSINKDLNLSKESSVEKIVQKTIDNQSEEEFEGKFKPKESSINENSLQNLKNLVSSNQLREASEEDLKTIKENEMRFRKKLSISRRTNSKDISEEEDLKKLEKMLTHYRSYKNSENP